MNQGQKNKMLELVSRYPSGDNAQPFSLRFVQDKLEIYFEPDRARHELDFETLTSCISLGCLIYSIEVVAHEWGFRIGIELSEQLPTPSVWCWIRFEIMEKQSSHELFSTVDERCTSRIPFQRDPRPTQFVKWLAHQENLVFREEDLQELAVAFEMADKLFWMHTPGVKDLFKTIHFFESDYLRLRTGMYWTELGIKLYEAPTAFLLKKAPFLSKIFYPLFLKYQLNQITKRNLQQSSVIVCIPQDIKDTMDLVKFRRSQVQVGRKGMEIWLQATKHGLLVQPISMPALLGNFLYLKRETLFLQSPKASERLKESVSNVCDFFRLKEGQKPGWILRIGNRPQNMKAPYRSLRLKIDSK